uniref:Uncharacterized protein n=1 Tax=Cyanoderma ruficeps TaxID=181631 RepID=A0A8C3XED0_9PASS
MEGKLLRSRRSLKPSITCTHSLLFNCFLLTSGCGYYCISLNGSFGYQDFIHCMDFLNRYCLMAVFNVTYLENEDYE